jgi:hypothetical protein
MYIYIWASNPRFARSILYLECKWMICVVQMLGTHRPGVEVRADI